jgi:hypothetical protein
MLHHWNLNSSLISISSLPSFHCHLILLQVKGTDYKIQFFSRSCYVKGIYWNRVCRWTISLSLFWSSSISKCQSNTRYATIAIVTTEVQFNTFHFLIISDIWNKSRVLTYGICGAVVFRAVMIALWEATIQVVFFQLCYCWLDSLLILFY